MNASPRLTAKSSAGLDKLTTMIHTLLNLVWGEDWGVFSEESPIDNDADKMILPHITYDLVKRVPKEGSSAKWTPDGRQEDPENPGETISYRRKWFTCLMEFTIHHDTNKGAREVAEEFEEFMETYVGHFKSEGVSEIIFREEKSPGVNSDSRQDLAQRTLVYEIRIEKIIAVHSFDLNKIDVVLRKVELDLTVDHPSGNQDLYHSTFSEDQPVNTHLGPSGFMDVYNKNFPNEKGGN